MEKVLFGMMLALIGLPIIDGIISLYEQIIQHLCSKIAVKTYKLQKELPSEERHQETYAMGFEIPSGESYEDDEYDE